MLHKRGIPNAGGANGEETPEEIKTPFLIKKVQCPVCKFRSEQRRFKIRLYAEKNVDIDKHAQSFSWVDKDFQNYHPPWYYFWHCPNCHFTESYLDFEDPGKPIWSMFRQLKEAYLQKTQEDQKVEKLVNWLSKGIDYDTINYTQAIRIHLLAIYVQQISDDETDWDTLKIGRYYLRTTWLLRELKQKRSRELGTVKTILSEVRKLWPNVLTSEEDGLKKAMKYLTDAYQKHPSIKSPVAEVDMLMWLSGIQFKLDDEEKGLEWLNQTIIRGQSTRQKIEKRMQNQNITEEEIHTLHVQQKKIGNIVARARDKMQDIQHKRFLLQKTEAKKLVQELLKREITPEQIRAKLKKKGFIPKVIAVVMPEEKKKKLFGLFG